MKENYNHENRHKYYLKCHLIFCIKYSRKILKGEFDDNIKTIFQSIADNYGYFVCSIGEAHPNTVKEYIRQQG